MLTELGSNSQLVELQQFPQTQSREGFRSFAEAQEESVQWLISDVFTGMTVGLRVLYNNCFLSLE